MSEIETQTPQASAEPARKPFVRRLLSVNPRDLLVLVLMSVIVGMVLAFLNVDPTQLWVDFFGAVSEAWTSFFGNLGEAVTWMARYFLLGAVIIVPIWLVWHIARSLSRR